MSASCQKLGWDQHDLCAPAFGGVLSPPPHVCFNHLTFIIKLIEMNIEDVIFLIHNKIDKDE